MLVSIFNFDMVASNQKKKGAGSKLTFGNSVGNIQKSVKGSGEGGSDTPNFCSLKKAQC
jgi:hypothetical protein